ncbi:hypothetical protein [Dactylosporangium sp. NPDC050588]|uniref:hypothetical protein n=1 Tax=Dactylosporangium sp. NPDC050588 TaxID=3157211 RepID=UPI0033EB6896
MLRLELMAGCGRLDEALELASGHPEGDTGYAAETVAGLLAGAGRTQEAVDVLGRHGSGRGGGLAGYLLDLGRVQDAVAVLHPARAQAGRADFGGTGRWAAVLSVAF